MDKPEKHMSFDYSFFVSIAALGGVLAAAAFLAFFGFDMPQIGYLSASSILLLTGIVLYLNIKKTKLNSSFNNDGINSESNLGAGVAMIMTSLTGDLVYTNKAAKALFEKYSFGDPKSPLKLKISNKNSIQEMMDNLKTGQTNFIVSEIGQTGKYLKFEIEKIHKNGDFFSWRIFEGAEAEGTLKNIATSSDGFLHLGSFFDNAFVGFFVVDENDNIIHANKHFLNSIYKNVKTPKLPIKLSAISDYSKKNLNGRVHFTSKETTIECFVKQWKDESSGSNCSFIVLEKPTEHNQLMDRNQSAATDNFFLNSPIGIAVVGNDGVIKEKNIIFGNFIAELEIENSDNLKSILQEDNAENVFKAINSTIETGKPSKKIDLVFQSDSEKQGQFYITANSSTSNNDVIIYLHDITEQKNLELQFSQSQKMQAVGQLAGGVAHDFNNLLTAITGFCDLLLVKHGPGDQSFSDIIQIKQNANRAANLVRQLLAFSRQQTLRPKVIIMTDVVAELSNLLRRLIGSNIELQMNHGRNIEPVRVDQGQLEQVIINLCVNARDAMPEGGKLEIKTRNISVDESIKINKKYKLLPKGEYVLLEVIDTGTGIAKEHIDKVFEPFFSTKEIGKGTGLGLSTVYGIIKQTNGFVFPDSELGVGTSFKIYLPKYVEEQNDIVVGNEGEAKIEDKAKDLTGNSTILLVEDEDAVRMFASRALKNKGYTVYEADSGVSALQLMEETDAHLDLLISDVMMPQMDGPTLVKKIRETDKDLKVIFISGYAEDALDDNIMDKDFNFLAKPFSLKQLAEQVKEVLEN